jgi:hypothetical protein
VATCCWLLLVLETAIVGFVRLLAPLQNYYGAWGRLPKCLRLTPLFLFGHHDVSENVVVQFTLSRRIHLLIPGVLLGHELVLENALINPVKPVFNKLLGFGKHRLVMHNVSDSLEGGAHRGQGLEFFFVFVEDARIFGAFYLLAKASQQMVLFEF